MPLYILKPEPDRDLYIEWSTIVDAPVGHGTRAEWVADGIAPARLDRADRTGTSAYRPLDVGAWDDAELMVAEPLGRRRLLPRDHLIDYTLALYRGAVTDAYGLTRPTESDAGYPPEPSQRSRAVRTHQRRCRRCNPAGNPAPLTVDGMAYARRRKARTRGSRH
ncbi:hypothetical protein [Actinomadura bangladeshensis]|uniref:Uncharacterized protein n=1 Tax=Actinomadura bangladeshensis TaxID=453573 RepID=A0A6L9Q981_9ACTN|nr:hypothetical protein [Actinomadura bangladeshensis]NEA21598.1 hypothetical protein [Actinomadura bangladeshensis]NEA22558.1 hypothetical protein [Actinomadura bangladeshensis]